MSTKKIDMEKLQDLLEHEVFFSALKSDSKKNIEKISSAMSFLYYDGILTKDILTRIMGKLASLDDHRTKLPERVFLPGKLARSGVDSAMLVRAILEECYELSSEGKDVLRSIKEIEKPLNERIAEFFVSIEEFGQLTEEEQDKFLELFCYTLEREGLEKGIPLEIYVTPENVQEWLKSGEKNSFKDYAAEKELEGGFEQQAETMDKFFSDLSDVLPRKLRDFLDACLSEDITLKKGNNGLLDFIPENIGNNVFMEDKPVRLNLLLSLEEERNSDNSYLRDVEIALIDHDFSSPEAFENALAWLVRQQGYSVKDLLDNEKKTPFLDSVREEIFNHTNDDSSFLTICCSAQTAEMDKAGLQERENNEKFLSFENGVTIGIFNPYCGGGSLMGIALDKPLTIPVSMIQHIQTEGARLSMEYSVDSVFGMTSQAWKAPPCFWKLQRYP